MPRLWSQALQAIKAALKSTTFVYISSSSEEGEFEENLEDLLIVHQVISSNHYLSSHTESASRTHYKHIFMSILMDLVKALRICAVDVLL